jgi:hypothetical protein
MPVPGVAHHQVVVGQQHGVEVVALEAATVHLGDANAVTGDADEADEALVPSSHERLDRAAGTVGDVELVGLDEVVQLHQVDLVDLQPLE